MEYMMQELVLGEWAVEWAGKGVEQWVVGDHLLSSDSIVVSTNKELRRREEVHSEPFS